MNTTVQILGLCVALATAGCLVRPYEHDPLPINARYAMKFKEPCSSWLRSPRTGYWYCASPPVAVELGGAKPAAAPMKSLASGPTDQASLMAHGEQIYGHICSNCHQPDGKGLEKSFPPLAGSGAYYGDAKNHARIIVHGLKGDITVQGVLWAGVEMPAQGAVLTDYDIAAVATFERLSWGNDDGIVLPEDVAAVR